MKAEYISFDCFAPLIHVGDHRGLVFLPNCNPATVALLLQAVAPLDSYPQDRSYFMTLRGTTGSRPGAPRLGCAFILWNNISSAHPTPTSYFVCPGSQPDPLELLGVQSTVMAGRPVPANRELTW